MNLASSSYSTSTSNHHSNPFTRMVAVPSLPPAPPASSFDVPPSLLPSHLTVPLPQFNESHFHSSTHHLPSNGHSAPPLLFISGGSETASTSTEAGGKARVLCAICGDGASGKHYGVTSCEGCKGFFKRTVRKDLSYACRHEGKCVIDKRQRNRCQHCRYRKCTEMGMKRDAVQEERQTDKGKQSSSVTTVRSSRSVEGSDGSSSLCSPSSLALFHQSRLHSWSSAIPAFYSLPFREQSIMMHYGWSELILLEMLYRSREGRLWLRDEESIGRSDAQQLGFSQIFDSILSLAHKIASLALDPMEFGALRLIILFNPDFPSLEYPGEMEIHRERVTSSLIQHCATSYPSDGSRSTRLLLSLPSLRYLSSRLRMQSIILPPAPPLSPDYIYSNPPMINHQPTVPIQYHQPPQPIVYYAQ